jgi:hypothetical protein
MRLLGRLAPARVIDVGVHVGVEAVLLGRGRGSRWSFGICSASVDADDRLHALEAVLPRHHQPQRRAVLVGQLSTVEADGEQRQRVHRLVHAQALAIGPRRARRSRCPGICWGSSSVFMTTNFAARLDRGGLADPRAASTQRIR